MSKKIPAIIQMKRTLSVFLILNTLIFCLLPLTALAEGQNIEIVKVGWYESDCFQEGSSDQEVKSGYCYEYLQKVADYTNWKYEYVYGSWAELYEMLEKGEIDLLAGVSITDERKEIMLFPEQFMGTDVYCLYKHSDNTEVIPGDSSTANGKIIGGIRNNRMTFFAKEWLQDNNLNAEIVCFDDFDELKRAFEKGKVDLITGTQNNVLSISNISMVAKVGEEPYYLAVSRKRKDLLRELNQALSTLQEMDPYLLQNLQYSNYGATVVNRTLTASEQEWINTHDCLRAGYMEDYAPFCTKTNNQPRGIMIEALEELWRELGLCEKLSIEYYSFNNSQDMEDALKNGTVDIIMPITRNLWYLENKGIDCSSAVISCSENLFFNGKADTNNIKTLAVNKNNTNHVLLCQNYYPDAKLVYYSNIKECLEAVVKGYADGTIVNRYRTPLVTGHKAYKKLSYIPFFEQSVRCFGVREEDSALLILLNRGIKTIGTEYGAGIANKYMTEFYSYTAYDFITDNLTGVALFITIIISAVIAVFLRNAAEHRKHEAELSKAMIAADAANKAKSQFLFNMSHDIRTPMNAIIGFANLMAEEIDDKEVLIEHIHKIRTAGDFLLSLINNVLDMARVENGKVELNETCTHIENDKKKFIEYFAKGLASHNLTLDVVSDFQHEYVFMDAIKYRQIYENLVSNAIKYSKEGGHIRTSLSEISSDGKIAKYQLVVEDDGIGMSEEYLPHVFDSFERERTSTDSSILGTGLGMAIVKKYVEIMNGSIEVWSKKDVGTRFTLTFPFRIASEEDYKKRPEPTRKVEKEIFRGRRILLAEDNDLNAEIAIKVLENAGLMVEHAKDGSICLEMLKKEAAGYYDLVLMDIQMPNMNGYEATKAIRNLDSPSKKKIPVIAMTANAFEEDNQNAIKAGMNGHVAKPIDVKKLLATLADTLNL